MSKETSTIKAFKAPSPSPCCLELFSFGGRSRHEGYMLVHIHTGYCVGPCTQSQYQAASSGWGIGMLPFPGPQQLTSVGEPLQGRKETSHVETRQQAPKAGFPGRTVCLQRRSH